MITKVTKDNYDAYQRLFAEINEKLSYAEDADMIKDIGDYFLALDDIRDHVVDTKSDYHLLILPLDEGLFEINANTRAISIPTEFARNGVAVQGDELAEVIYFSIDRYFDTTDLFERDILIQYELPNGDQGLVVPLNKTIDFVKDKVVFGWAIDSIITEQAGNVKFSVRFYERGEEDGEPVLKFGFGTLTSTIKINQSLNMDIEDEDAIAAILTDKTQKYYDFMRSSTKDSADVMPADPSIVDISPATGNTTTGVELKGRALFTEAALTDNKSIGELSYEFAYTDKNDNPSKMTATAAYEKAEVDTYNQYDNYWVSDNGIKPYTKYFYNADTWDEDKENLYYQYATLTPTQPGKYQLVAVNTTGRGKNKYEASVSTEPWIIPFAAEVGIEIADHIMIDDDTNLAVLNPTYTRNDNGDLTYQWFRDNETISVDGTNATYKAANEGTYHVEVSNTLNGDTTVSKSDNVIVSLSPLAPAVVQYLANDSVVDIDTANIFYYPTTTTIGVSVGALGTRSDKITYQWYKQSSSGKEAIGEASESAELTLPGTGVYSVDIINTYKTFEKITSSKQFIVQPET